MNPNAMEPFGRALLAYLDGDSSAQLLLRRDDGKESVIPASLFFRDESDFTALERKAMELCCGRVLDIGAGAGSQSIALQGKGHVIVALDISPEAVAVARRRGVRDVRCADVFSFHGGPFDTLLMMGHGIGMVETIEGLKSFLTHAHSLLAVGGQLLFDSLDVRITDDPDNLAYHHTNRNAGCYIGEIRMQFEFNGQKGPLFGWLQVDPATLSELSEASGWDFEVVACGESGDYLARLVKAKAAP